MDRTRVAWMSGALIFALGVLCALSFNALSDFKIWHYNFFDLFDTLSGKLLLPLGGLLIAVFYGWVLGPQACAATIGKPSQSILVQGLLWSARIIAPLLVGVVLWNGLAEL